MAFCTQHFSAPVQVKHCSNLGLNAEEHRAFFNRKLAVYQKQYETELSLLLITNRKSNKPFCMPQKSLTLNDLEGSLRTLCQ